MAHAKLLLLPLEQKPAQTSTNPVPNHLQQADSSGCSQSAEAKDTHSYDLTLQSIPHTPSTHPSPVSPRSVLLHSAAMLRRDVDQATKIRKRCALSSSSSSQDPRRTTRRRLRLKRSVRLVGRTGCGGASSPCKIICSRRRKRMSESSWSRHHRRVETRPTSAASARKLVSALWQLDKGPGACGEEEGEVGWDAAAARRGSDHRRSASVEFSKLSRRKSRALEGDGERSWHNGHAHGHWFSDVMSNGGTMEAHACPQGLASPCPGDRTAQLQDLHNSLTASKELEMRREAAESAREELEREREMLLMADELREERVRMKLAEARIQFEEKNAVVDRLRQELEAFLGRDKDIHESPATDEHHRADDDRRLQLVLASSEPIVHGIDHVVVRKNGEDGEQNGEVDDDGSDNGSDIELNMDGNSWSYSTAASNKETTANNNNAASRHGSFSDRGTDGGVGAFDQRSHGFGVALEQQHWVDEGCSDDDDNRTSTKDVDEDAERYEAIKNLREQMLAGHGFVFLSQGGADADHRDDHRRHGLVCQVQDAGMW
ncbi:hypothetical protein EJB05_21581, partial [Eragrostis curvula]